MNFSKIGIIIPTLNAGPYWVNFLSSIDKLPFKNVRKLIIDSSSTDETANISIKAGWEVKIINSSDFNHGGTRQLGAEILEDCEILCYLTQDVIVDDCSVFNLLIGSFSDSKVGAVCGRQLPHKDANPLAQHSRKYNYPDKSNDRTFKDVAMLGTKAAFMSNSFAAYRRSALIDVGGFPDNIIFGEDLYVTAKMLTKGWSVSYNASAYCYHSHNYTNLQEFRRYFDIGVLYSREHWIVDIFGNNRKEGLEYVKSELSYLIYRDALWIPSSILRNVTKFLAYKLGRNERIFPKKINKFLSMNKIFW